MIRWTLLDERLAKDQSLKAMTKMSTRGATTTWGIDLAQHAGSEGYTCFRVVQIDRNLNGNNHMCLGGIEVYGVPTNPEIWAFYDLV